MIEHEWHLNVDIDELAIARISLSIGSPFHYICSDGTSGVITPWQSYSRLYKKKYGVYPEMWGYTTLTDESEEQYRL